MLCNLGKVSVTKTKLDSYKVGKVQVYITRVRWLSFPNVDLKYIR